MNIFFEYILLTVEEETPQETRKTQKKQPAQEKRMQSKYGSVNIYKNLLLIVVFSLFSLISEEITSIAKDVTHTRIYALGLIMLFV